MDKIQRMIKGEQHVAALDHINSLLKTLPSEPWLLAFKCQVLMSLGELDSLEETSAKFIRLQPDNPLAKLNRAMVALIRGAIDEAATLYLQAIFSKSVEVSTLLLTVLSNLVQFLQEYGNPLSAYLHLELAVDRFEGIEEYAGQLQAKLLQNTRYNLLCRDTIPSPPEADDAEFAERYREAIAMMYAGDVPHAKTKLEGIQREFGTHTAISIALLHCKLYLIDTAGAAETCLKLVHEKSVPMPQRIYFFALACELDGNKAGAIGRARIREISLSDEAAFETALANNTDMMAQPAAEAKEYFNEITGDEVPAKSVYEFRVLVDDPEMQKFNARSSVGMLAVYGRQTDKPARAIIYTTEGTLPALDEKTQAAYESLGLQDAQVLRDDKIPVPFVAQLNIPLAIDREIASLSPEEQKTLSEASEQVRTANLLALVLPAFNGKSLAQAAADPAYSAEAAGVLLHTVTGGQLGLTSDDYVAISQKLNLDVPVIAADVDGFDYVGAAYYYWADATKMDSTALFGLVTSAMMRQHLPVYPAMLKALNAAEMPEAMKANVDLIRRQLMLSMTRDPHERVEQLEALYDATRAAGRPAGEVGVALFQILSQMGDGQRAGTVIRRVVDENPEDPVVREFIYMLNMQMQQMQSGQGGRGGDNLQAGLARRALNQSQNRALGQAPASPAPAAKPQNDSGLWTPEKGSPAAPQTGSGSGLWIPGS